MPIYTRTGDKGDTALLGGVRVPKDDVRVEAYGSIDELNSVIGVLLVYYQGPRLKNLKEVQRTLFAVGAQLASPKPIAIVGIDQKNIEAMEKDMDEIENALPPLRNFILPGGSETAALLHLARTVCRRSERRIITLSKQEKINPQIIIYINRLGDWLFMLAREENANAKIKDEEWKP